MTDSSHRTPASLFFIGNATMILRFGDVTLLTDPNFLHAGQRAYLGHGLWSRRLTEPALHTDALPALDGIILSHLHGDHWDRNAHRGLDRSLPVVTTVHASKRLQRRGFSHAVGLRRWESHVLVAGEHRVRITAMPGRHAVGWLRHLLPPVMGSMLEFGPLGGSTELRMYISGDTLLVDDLREIPDRFPEIDGAMLHLGGTTLPGGFIVTMDGEQGVGLLKIVRPAWAVPIHHSDYGLFKSPLSDFLAAAERANLPTEIRVVAPGESIQLTAHRPNDS
jgi:L-ascorbate metabolism protein UlaG (beta-lactamase superfamily)